VDRARILVVEDEELVALAIKKCLEGLGYEVPEVVTSGEEAVQKSADLRADLVLMDIHLKGRMSGIDAAGVIKDTAGVPVVYLTAYSDPDTLNKARLTEPFGYLLKPFEERSLDATVKMALSLARGQKELRGSKDTMSAILYSIRDAIIVASPNGTIEFANEKASSLFNLPTPLPPFTSVVPLLGMIRTGSSEPLTARLDEVALNGLSVQLPRCEVAFPDGSTIPVEVSLEPYRAEDRSSKGILLVFRDHQVRETPPGPAPHQKAAEPRAAESRAENLIQKSEKAIKEAAEPDLTRAKIHAPAPERSAIPVVGDTNQVRDARAVDGRIEVRVSEDRMTAFAAFYPARGSGRLIELSGVEYLLEARGVRFGIDWDAVKSSIQSCNTSRKTLAEVEIAHGVKPVEEINSHIEIEPALLAKDPQSDPGSLVVDFKAQSPFRFVKTGDVLARVEPRKDGHVGTDVTGVAIAYGKITRRSARPGKNTVTEGDTVTAGCDGKFVATDETFWVNEVLEIPGDVDYSTGHIDFPGDVIVQGQIKQGFKVKAGGSLTCNKTIDASEVECGGDLVTNGGILGRVQSTVKAGGQIRAKFIENCTVEAGGDVIVSTGCLNSIVNTLGSVTTGNKGVVIGGKLCAQKGVTAFQIGSSTGVKTEICIGEDYRVRQKLAWIKEKNAELTGKLKEVETSLAVREKGNPRLQQMRDKLKAAIQKMNDSAKSLTTSLASSKVAAVAARGDLHLGVTVEICRVPFLVTKPMNAVRLVLDKTSLVISAERLGRA
jgi:uncharacterized protein (DUF342 family)/AmiR/NasT family two-component response regulator